MKRVWAFCVCLILGVAFLWGEVFTSGTVVFVLDNLRLRSTGSMDGSAIVTIQKGSLLEVIGTGKNETIDGIDSSWVNVKVLESTRDKDGSLVQEETEGWCFGGYLTPVQWGKKYERHIPEMGIRSVELNAIYEYNRDGKEVYSKTHGGSEEWFEYDENGNEIYYRKSHSFGGYEEWYEYDEQGNKIHMKASYDYEEWYEYDEHGSMIYYKDSHGTERWYWYEYDENGNEIYNKDSDGDEEWKEYDENGNLIHCKNSDGREAWREYDENGNYVYGKNYYGDEEVITYNEKGYTFCYIPYDGGESCHRYDENGNEIGGTAVGSEFGKNYNKKGLCVYSYIYGRYSGSETWYEYIYWPDGTVRKKLCFEYLFAR